MYVIIIKVLRFLLLPFSLLYGLVMKIRNYLYDKSYLSNVSFNIPIISIGNLAVGGTGKTPHTEFLIELLQYKYQIAVLSRGYKRETKGFVLADASVGSKEIGDEPYQIFKKFTSAFLAVDEDRVHGVRQLLKQKPTIQLILLDDAYQHRKIKPGLSILLTDFQNLYTRDFVIPAGRLREKRNGSQRADIIIVTKCPDSISKERMHEISEELAITEKQSLFYSTYIYKNLRPVFTSSISKIINDDFLFNEKVSVLLLTGIVNPQPIMNYLNRFATINIQSNFVFPDHHSFKRNDFVRIEKKFNQLKKDQDKIIITTEKDASRILCNKEFPESLKPFLYILPIEVKLIEKEQIFIQKIIDYVEENS